MSTFAHVETNAGNLHFDLWVDDHKLLTDVWNKYKNKSEDNPEEIMRIILNNNDYPDNLSFVSTIIFYLILQK